MPRAHHGCQVKELKEKENSNAADTEKRRGKKSPWCFEPGGLLSKRRTRAAAAARARYGVEPSEATPYAPRAQHGARRARDPHGVVSTGLKRRRAARATV